MKTVTVQTEEGEFTFPARWAICPCCHGEGKREHPAFSNGVDPELFEDDPDGDFAADYFGGAFDVPCKECKGTGKFLEIAEELVPEKLRGAFNLYREEQRGAALEEIAARWEKKMLGEI